MTLETRYRCPDCQFERTLVYGTHWEHVNELHRYKRDIQRGKYGDPAKKWLTRYPDGMLTISAALFSCPRCHTLQTAEHLLLEHPGAPSWTLPVRCTACHAVCLRLTTPPLTLPCTACGKTCRICQDEME